jgi:hypothetical protein
MNVKASPMTVHDYCVAWDRSEIRVNRAYQRSPKVWPPAARAYLIESLVKQYPIPKLSLHQLVDAKTKTPFKEIVDGQQRTMAIVDFYKGSYRLASTLESVELKDRLFEELDEDDRAAFLNYSLDIDLFLATSPAEVREAFRRMNSYTIPLNAEEQRHARWQGQFKWFVNELAHEFSESLFEMGVFTEKQVIRMQDMKLFAEVLHAMHKGIQTTKQKQLNDLYKEFDKSFDTKKADRQALERAVERLANWPQLHNTSLMKPYNIYALLLALIHVHKELPKLRTVLPLGKKKQVPDEYALANLTLLSDALDEPDEHEELDDFVAATRARTNVKEQREVRFTWMCKAITEKSL